MLRGKRQVKSRLAIAALLMMAILLSSCGSDNHSTQKIEVAPIGNQSDAANKNTEDSNPALNQSGLLKPEVAMSFQPVELSPLEQVKVKDSWKQTKTQPFGQMNGEPVSLSVYQEEDEAAMCSSSYERIVLLEYKKQKFRYEGCGSTSLESEHPEQDQASVILNAASPDEGSSSIILGAVDSGVNGPGLMVYYVYDKDEDRWYGFNRWGLPSVDDLDGDGTKELIIQFEGLHLHPPDVSIGRWNGKQLEISPTVTEQLGLPSHCTAWHWMR
jgi:hypothetical protein